MWEVFLLIVASLFLAKAPALGALLLTLAILALGWVVGSLVHSWLLYSLILLFVGGMMILFVYVCAFTGSVKMSAGGHFNLAALGLVILMSVKMVEGNFSFTREMGSHVDFSFLAPNFFWVVAQLYFLILGLVVSVQICTQLAGPLKFAS